MQEFKIDENIKILCKTQNTRNGFRHIASFYEKGNLRQERSMSYLNRTWESFEYESVIINLLEKMGFNNEERQKFLEVVSKISRGETASMFKTVGAIASLGNIFCEDKKDKNDWKKRMLKAGLPDLSIPEDWESLSEEEKEKRLNKVIDFAGGRIK